MLVALVVPNEASNRGDEHVKRPEVTHSSRKNRQWMQSGMADHCRVTDLP